MVYESSTRRIYSSSSPRPVISTSYSYSPLGPIPVVTKLQRQPHLVLTYAPGTGKGHIINPIAIPNVAHRRLVSVSPPRRSQNGQNYYDLLESGISGGNFGNNRIVLVRYRPSPPPVPQSKVMYIEDVTDSDSYGKEIRLLRRELSPSPSLIYGSPWDTGVIPISRPMFSLHNIPLRSASEVKEVADLRRLYVRERNPDVGYSPLNKALLYRMQMPVYVDPTIPQSYYIGRGNLACLSFAAGRPIPKRRRFYPDFEDKIQDEVIYRSFYTKLRDAADRNVGKRPIYQPIYYSKKTIMGKLGDDNFPKRVPKESKWVERALANTAPPPPRAKPAPVATETVVPPPRKESLKLERPPATPPPVKPVNVTLPKPRKSITEIIKTDVPKVESSPVEEVTVKAPPPKPKEPTPPPPKEPTPPPPAKEPTPPPPKEATPPPPPAKEPTPPPPKEATPPPPAKEPTPPPAKEPTPPPAPKEPTPPPAKEPTPPPPAKDPSPPPAAPEVESPAPAIETPAPSEPASEISAPAEAVASLQATGDEATENKESSQAVSVPVESSEAPVPVVSPKQTEGSAEQEPTVAEAAPPASTSEPEDAAPKEPVNDQAAAAPISIVVADIDGPVPPPDVEVQGQEEHQTVEEIQAAAERKRNEFAQLLDDYSEICTTVTKLEKVKSIVIKSCEEALAQEQDKQQPPSSTSDSQKNPSK